MIYPGKWSSFPGSSGSEVEGSPEHVSLEVTGIGAICDIYQRDPSAEGSASFVVGEFLNIANGDRVLLHLDRGFTLSGSLEDHVKLPLDLFVEQIRNVVLPDEGQATNEDHDWDLLVDLARRRGISIEADQLREVRYEILVTDRVLSWLEPPTGNG